jgi:hypothetical protein
MLRFGFENWVKRITEETASLDPMATNKTGGRAKSPIYSEMVKSVRISIMTSSFPERKLTVEDFDQIKIEVEKQIAANCKHSKNHVAYFKSAKTYSTRLSKSTKSKILLILVIDYLIFKKWSSRER